MSYGDYQEHFEKAAIEEKRRYDGLPISALLHDIRARRFGHYYQIWRSVAERAPATEAAKDLFNVLESNTDYLNRYHCASALISVTGLYSDGWRAEHLSAEPKHPVKENLNRIHELFSKQIP